MKKSKKRIYKLIISLLIIFLFVLWSNKSIVVTKYFVTNEKIPKEFLGFTIVQISDLHNYEFGKENSKLINKIRKINPDIIVITGDLIDSRKTDIQIGIDFVKNAIKIAPTYYVTGNHEFRVLDEYLVMEKIMEQTGTNILRNEEISIEKDGSQIQIIGIDSNIYGENGIYVPGENNVVVLKMLEEMNKDGLYTVLLSHRPELFNIYVDRNIDLAFTGHAHGGQIRIPFLGGIVAPNQGFFPKYDSGTYIEENTTMVVSRGIGNSIIPIRVNNRPEIVVTIFENKDTISTIRKQAN